MARDIQDLHTRDIGVKHRQAERIVVMDKTVGVLGGGQLGRMFTEAANRLNIKVITLDAAGCPASQINAGNLEVGSFKDPQAIKKLASKVDVITTEIEHINTQALTGLDPPADIQPHPKTIEIIKDKFLQKEYLLKRRIPVAKSVAVKPFGDAKDVADAIDLLNGSVYPQMLKAREDAYDGRGNFVLRSSSDIPEAVEALGGSSRKLYLEEWVPFEMELAVMVVKTEDKPDADWQIATLAFPVVETVHEASQCKLCYVPPRQSQNSSVPLADSIQRNAQEFARKSVAGFGGKGVFGVEMFLCKGDILINEIAPRPHNSGHLTIEACGLSQYDCHLRAILNLPIDPKSLEADRAAVMLNILGDDSPDGHLKVRSKALEIPRASIHMYGKGNGTPGRKMGHVTVTARTLVEAEERIQPLINIVDQIRAERLTREAAKQKSSTTQVPTAISKTSSSSSGQPRVAITMGSDSDRTVLKAGAELLEKFGIPYMSDITSAHRTPQRLSEFAKEAEARGVQVIIAAAGGAAHLPGMLASETSLPVIGVPVKATHLDGLDSLLSIVQMPRGVPTATVGINNSINAALLAIRILALNDPEIKQKLDKYIQDQTNEVLRKAERMQQQGIESYTPPPAS